jgi:hypothetical protein
MSQGRSCRGISLLRSWFSYLVPILASPRCIHPIARWKHLTFETKPQYHSTPQLHQRKSPDQWLESLGVRVERHLVTVERWQRTSNASDPAVDGRRAAARRAPRTRSSRNGRGACRAAMANQTGLASWIWYFRLATGPAVYVCAAWSERDTLPPVLDRSQIRVYKFGRICWNLSKFSRIGTLRD